jgi:hypothetical protein
MRIAHGTKKRRAIGFDFTAKKDGNLGFYVVATVGGAVVVGVVAGF